MTQPVMIYVLNLDRAPERWQGCLTRLERLGVEQSRIQRIPGFDALEFWNDGRRPLNLNPCLLAQLVEEGLIREGEVPHIGPDFCIAASHLRVLRRIRDAGHAWAMVLEDDFELTDCCRSRLDFPNLDTLPPDAEWIWLHDGILTHRDDRGIIRRAVGGHGTVAYLVSLRGSSTARATLLPVVAPCDLQLSAFTKGFHRPGLRREYVRRKCYWGWRARQAEEALFLHAYARFPPLFTHRRGPSLKHQAADLIYSRSG